jgi:hypothetical protein
MSFHFSIYWLFIYIPNCFRRWRMCNPTLQSVCRITNDFQLECCAGASLVTANSINNARKNKRKSQSSNNITRLFNSRKQLICLIIYSVTLILQKNNVNVIFFLNIYRYKYKKFIIDLTGKLLVPASLKE